MTQFFPGRFVVFMVQAVQYKKTVRFAALFFLVNLAVAAPLHRTVDLRAGESVMVEVAGSSVRVRLAGIEHQAQPVTGAVTAAFADVVIAGERKRLECGNYRLPEPVGPVRVDCTVTAAYYANSNSDHWALKADARLRIWPAGGPLIPPQSFGFPLAQRWLASMTQMANEPVHVDGGEHRPGRRIYYHSGLDSGGADGLIDVLAAADGLIVSLGDAVMPEHKSGTPVAARYDVIYLLDERGWYHRYSHLDSFAPDVKLGARVLRGHKLGTLGKEGASGGWAHLHFELKARQPSGGWGTEEGYAFLWEAYLQEAAPDVIAVARPHKIVRAGGTVTLDASRSWARSGRIREYRWTFHDGTTATGRTVQRRYDRPGTYSEIVEVRDSGGNRAHDFAKVRVLGGEADPPPPGIHAAFAPTSGLRPGAPVTFLVRSFRVEGGEEVWNFGDGSPEVRVRSDGGTPVHAKDGYARTTHVFAKPGTYIVRVRRESAGGTSATAHLAVTIDPPRR